MVTIRNISHSNPKFPSLKRGAWTNDAPTKTAEVRVPSSRNTVEGFKGLHTIKNIREAIEPAKNSKVMEVSISAIQ